MRIVSSTFILLASLTTTNLFVTPITSPDMFQIFDIGDGVNSVDRELSYNQSGGCCEGVYDGSSLTLSPSGPGRFSSLREGTDGTTEFNASFFLSVPVNSSGISGVGTAALIRDDNVALMLGNVVNIGTDLTGSISPVGSNFYDWVFQTILFEIETTYVSPEVSFGDTLGYSYAVQFGPLGDRTNPVPNPWAAPFDCNFADSRCRNVTDNALWTLRTTTVPAPSSLLLLLGGLLGVFRVSRKRAT